MPERAPSTTPTTDSCIAANSNLFDHFVGAGEHGPRRDVETACTAKRRFHSSPPACLSLRTWQFPRLAQEGFGIFQRRCVETPDEAGQALPPNYEPSACRPCDRLIFVRRCRASSTSGSSAAALKPSRAGTSNSLAA